MLTTEDVSMLTISRILDNITKRLMFLNPVKIKGLSQLLKDNLVQKQVLFFSLYSTLWADYQSKQLS